MVSVALALGAIAPPAFAQSTAPSPQALDAQWSGARAMKDIATQLSFGRRGIGTEGHAKTIEFIKRELARAGAAKIETQSWTDDNGGSPLHLTNVIGRFDLMRTNRIIVGTHYDSIIRAYADKENPQGPMPGANNSASGVAVLLETARALSKLPPPAYGIDFVFFDGEEGPKSLGAGDPNWRALGSPYFAAHLADFYPAQKPIAAVIFDMVCFKNLKLIPDAASVSFAENEVERFWQIGQEVAPSVFNASPGRIIGDDQVALAQAGIPSFLVIDFDYDPWFNTTKDTLDKCSAQSLDAVGRTLLRYLYNR